MTLPELDVTILELVGTGSCRTAGEVAAIVSRMKLEDLRVFALRNIGKAQTGDWREFHIHKGKWRATEFFSLDMDNLRTLEASA